MAATARSLQPDTPGPILSVTVAESDGITEIRVCGELDLVTAPLFGDYLRAAAAATTEDLVVDLAGLTFMDSTGISQLVSASREMRETQTLILSQAAGVVRRAIEITGLANAPRIAVLS